MAILVLHFFTSLSIYSDSINLLTAALHLSAAFLDQILYRDDTAVAGRYLPQFDSPVPFYAALTAAMHTARLRNQTRLIRLSPRHEFRDEHRSRHGGVQSKLSKSIPPVQLSKTLPSSGVGTAMRRNGEFEQP